MITDQNELDFIFCTQPPSLELTDMASESANHIYKSVMQMWPSG